MFISRCVVPECEATNSTEYSPAWLAAAQPAGARDSRCARRAPRDPSEPCGEASAFTDELLPCDQWIYASANTIVTEVSLYLCLLVS